MQSQQSRIEALGLPHQAARNADSAQSAQKPVMELKTLLAADVTAWLATRCSGICTYVGGCNSCICHALCKTEVAG